MTPIVPLEYCSFNQKAGVLVVASEFFGGTFPKEVSVKSNHTGNIVRFVQDEEAAVKAEFWDGEQCEYIPVDPTNNCNRLVVIHEY